MAQIRKRVLEANNALRESGLAWSSGDAGAEGEGAGEHEDDEDDEEGDEDEDDEEDVEEGEDEDEQEREEDDEEDDGEDNIHPYPPSLIPSTHVWVLTVEQSDGYNMREFSVRRVYRHFIDALQHTIEEAREYGFGEKEDDDMHFNTPSDFVGIATQDVDSYEWRFEDQEGGFMTYELTRMIIL
jgi:hypothetical protein